MFLRLGVPSKGLSLSKLLVVDTVSQNRLNYIKNQGIYELCPAINSQIVNLFDKTGPNASRGGKI